MSPRDQAEALADAVVGLEAFSLATELQAAGDLSGVDRAGVEFAIETLSAVGASVARTVAMLVQHGGRLAIDSSTGSRRST